MLTDLFNTRITHSENLQYKQQDNIVHFTPLHQTN